jgi:hypothetical protein
VTTYFFAGKAKDPWEEALDDRERFRLALEAIANLDEDECVVSAEAWTARRLAREALGLT